MFDNSTMEQGISSSQSLSDEVKDIRKELEDLRNELDASSKKRDAEMEEMKAQLSELKKGLAQVEGQLKLVNLGLRLEAESEILGKSEVVQGAKTRKAGEVDD